jgi:ribosome-associated protein
MDALSPDTRAGTRPACVVREEEVEFTAIRAQGRGRAERQQGPSAVHLRYRIAEASLPEDPKQRLLELRDHRITAEGVVVIKAQTQRSQELNRLEALQRLQAWIDSVAVPPRRGARPSPPAPHAFGAAGESQRGPVKQQRSRPRDGQPRLNLLCTGCNGPG